MKKVDLSQVVANVRGIVLEDATIKHMLESSEEGFTAVLNALGCDPAEITILSGAVIDDSATPNFTVTAGWAAYNDEIFQIDARAFAAAGGETAVWMIETSYAASDPVPFTDGNEFNVNEIRKLKLQSAVSGSAIADYNNTFSLSEVLLDLLGVQDLINAVIDAAPGALDTLNELAAALGDDPNYAATVTAALATKLDDTTGVSNAGNTGAYTKLKTKVLEIGDWNMDSTGSKSVTHGLGADKIRSVDVIVRNDANTLRYDFLSDMIYISASSGIEGSLEITSTQINLRRLTGGSIFDSTDFDSTSYNRGWVTITYED